MKDFSGQTLEVGDEVVHGAGGRYGGLHGVFRIYQLTPKGARCVGEELYQKLMSGELSGIRNRRWTGTFFPAQNLVKVPHERV